MSTSQTFGAGPPTTFLDADMDVSLNQAHFGDQHEENLYQNTATYGQDATDFAGFTGENAFLWPAGYTGPQYPYRQQHLSVSTQSSGLSGYRSSGSSFFPDHLNRFSAISSNSTWSNTSALPNDSFALPGQQHLGSIPQEADLQKEKAIDNSHVQPSRRRTTSRAPQEKDYYKSCVSRTRQRSRRTTTVQRYFCTACREPFVEKADWKRHEEEYQERPEQYECDNCYAIYFLDKNFVTHHKNNHGCIPCSEGTKCSEKRHVQSARKLRKRRTGYGCGFCYHFSETWTERCNHIAHHFDHEHKTMAHWNHSVVIYSLLQRPIIREKWEALLRSKQRHFIGFGWDARKTGRVEGYPESNPTPQLQDVLEYFTPNQEAAALVKWAFDQAVPMVARHREKTPPPVPPKDYHNNHNASLHDLMKDTESWNQFAQSIISDDWLPTGTTTLEGDSQDEHTMSWLHSTY